ncbi:hypothetical protein ACRYCC_39085 [Actinomadura scrupuli]|uniref:hypothetical protein n=1 Tax=Actinomadura scrupuli TaxID=559629 RepID=UPI003D9598C8
MTSFSPTFHGPGWAAHQMVFLMGDESVEPVPVTSEELRPTDDDVFVHPDGRDWLESDRIVAELGVLVIVGDPGTGRGTAALRRMREQCRTDRLFRLEANWDQPKARLLPPAQPGHGYILDLSEYGKAPSTAFGTELRSWAAQAGAYLAVLICAAKTDEQWLRPLRDQIVRIPTPASKSLATSMLQSTGAVHLVARLNDDAFSAIWESSPRASEVSRLVGILRATNPDTPNQKITEEFLGWQDWFKNDCPRDFGLRTLIWSAAMCDGGQRKSVLAMSEALHEHLGDKRTPVEVFSDAFASQRLEDAKISGPKDGVRLDPQSHGLAAAVRLHLWEQFENYRKTLLDWSVGCVLELDADDARCVVASLMDLAVRLKDHALVQELFDALSGKRPELLVEELSKAALDPVLGAYVRGRLYTWLAAKPSQEKVDVVAAVCGGQFGQAKPGLALTRLGRAALKSPNPISPALMEAFTSLGASKHRRLVLDTIQRLLSKTELERAGVVAFLCLAGTERGMVVLCGDGGRELASAQGGAVIAKAFQKALDHEDTHDIAVGTARLWRDAADHGLLDRDRVIELFGAAIGRDVKRGLLPALADDDPNGINGFVGDVLEYLIQRSQDRTAGRDTAEEPESLGESPRADRPVTMAIPDASTGEISLERQGTASADEA